MTYILEDPGEAERLLLQASFPAYDFKTELTSLRLKANSRILDAGCGAGVVSRHLATAYPKTRVVACDISPERLEATRQHCKGLSNVETSVQDLKSPTLEPRSFDVIICRYVLQHIARADDILKVFANFFDLLKPGGVLHVVDVDGLIVNLHPQPPVVSRTLQRFAEAGIVDLHVGRKIPSLLKRSNFSDIDWRIEVVDCQKETRSQEVELMEQRFRCIKPFLISFLGGEKKCEEFTSAYLETLKDANAVYFFNKFILSANRQRAIKAVK